MKTQYKVLIWNTHANGLCVCSSTDMGVVLRKWNAVRDRFQDLDHAVVIMDENDGEIIQVMERLFPPLPHDEPFPVGMSLRAYRDLLQRRINTGRPQ